MAEDDDGYTGDLSGRPTVNATTMDCGVCQCGFLIGVDLHDSDGSTIAHGHMDIDTAMTFAEKFAEAVGKVASTLSRAH